MTTIFNNIDFNERDLSNIICKLCFLCDDEDIRQNLFNRLESFTVSTKYAMLCLMKDNDLSYWIKYIEKTYTVSENFKDTMRSSFLNVYEDLFDILSHDF